MIIEVDISNKIARLKKNEDFAVCENSGYVISFDFDDEWNEYETKTARFKYNGQCVDVVFNGTECEMPIIENTWSVEIGVFAGNLRTTTPVFLSMRKSIRSECGSPVPPPDDVYDQIMEALDGINAEIGNLDDLETEDKSSLVAAINEAAQTGGGAVDSVNGKTGDVVLTADDVGALRDDTVIPSTLADLSTDSAHRTVTDAEKATWNGKQDALGYTPYNATNPDGYQTAPQVESAIVGKGYQTEAQVLQIVSDATTDMATETWVDNKGFITANDIPVLSVNGKTGSVMLTAADLGIGSVFQLKGSKQTASALPQSGNVRGDVWYVVDESVGYIWLNDGITDRWEMLGMSVDLSQYVTTTAMATALAGYVEKVNGKGLSTNDFTDAYKSKLDQAITSLAGYATEAWVEGKGYGTYSKPSGGIPDSDIASASAWNGKQDANIGVSHAGEFLIVGTDGKITSRTMEAWEGGSF